MKKDKIPTPIGLRPVTKNETIYYEAGQLHDFAANLYAGGYNTYSFPGVFLDHYTYDFDFENPIEREFKDENLSLQAFHTPVDPMFALVDFEFPKKVKYPCIAIHDDGSIIFPRKANSVYASSPSLYHHVFFDAKSPAIVAR